MAPRQEGEGSITTDAIGKACEDIVRALRGTYTTPDGKQKPVQGDITKVLYSSSLSPIARRLLYNASAMSREIPGTHEIRRRARSITKSICATYGLPTFITFTADENHSAIMLRLFRLRQCDPAVVVGDPELGRWAGRLEPPLTAWDALGEDATPTYEVRRKILTNSAISAADGFRIQLFLLLKNLLGLRVCLDCPWCGTCDKGDQFCCDAEGLSCEIEGGSIARVLAAVGTSEFQKKRDEHFHFQAVVECLHTSCTLHEIADILQNSLEDLVRHYKAYVEGVCVQGYRESKVDAQAKYRSAEETWPLHRSSRRLSAIPAYLSQGPAHFTPTAPADSTVARRAVDDAGLPPNERLAEGRRWVEKYHHDLDYVIEKRQEHIHPNGLPLTACRTKDKPTECKHGFMKDHLICPEARLLCNCIANELGFATAGRRNAVGSLLPSRTSGSVNGTIPSFAVGSGNNGDIKVPYRLPILETTRDAVCKERCFEKQSVDAISEAVDDSQAAQVGYHCDYCNKRQPIGLHECREWAKGHVNLAEKLQDETLTYATRRHAQRVLSDCFARGILRTPNETAKLNDAVGHSEPTRAEVTTTAPFGTFSGEAFLSLVEQRASTKADILTKGLLQARSKLLHGECTVLLKRIGLLYGYRGNHSDLLYLSPWEFVRYWEVIPLAVGKKPGKSSTTVKSFDASRVPAEVAEKWVIARRDKPIAPVFHGCPMPRPTRTGDARTPRILMAYFHPWTLVREWAGDYVPHVTELCGAGNWNDACTTWLHGHILTEEMRRVVTHFLSTTRVRPRDRDVEAAQSDEPLSDEECFVGDEDLHEVLLTKVGGRAGAKTGALDGHHENAAAAIARVQDVWAQDVDHREKRAKRALQPVPTAPWDAKAMRQKARESAAGDVGARTAAEKIAAASLSSRALPTAAECKRWVEEKCAELCAEQLQEMRRVVARCVAEMEEDSRSRALRSEPVRWLTHGKPGVGKSKLIGKIVEFFEDCMGWKRGVQFHVCTLQASLAAALNAETCHHVGGLNPFKRFQLDAGGVDAFAASESVQIRLVLSRWLLIDEVFMLSAQFLAELESTVRGGISETSPYKTGPVGHRSWGGLNLLTFGDSYQLDCPEGTPLYHTPSAYLPRCLRKPETISATRGLDLFWEDNENESMQGVTELTTHFRCKDSWWNAILDEIRTLQLSDDSHAFLHGLETAVPGSWLHGRPQCAERRCIDLVGIWARSAESWETRRQMECKVCQEERRTRNRVAPVGALQCPTFELVPAAVPNNDLRYEINKLRAQRFARHRNSQLLWCPAKDTATIDALREDPSLSWKKKEWLQRHDRQCGDLMGMLPLVRDMPLILMEHLDRSPEKRMMKGTKVLLHSVQLHPEDEKASRGKEVYVLQHLPVCVYVRKPGATWKIGDCAVAGVYPIAWSRSKWFLDGARGNPRLGIVRRQLPVSPGWAVTIHSMQGREEDPLLVDVCISAQGSKQTCYVALSRAKHRLGVHLLRPFPRDTFQGRSPLGPELLMKRLRREAIDWEAVAAELKAGLDNSKTSARKKRGGYLPCSGPCFGLYPREEFTATQRGNGADRLCPTCSASNLARTQEQIEKKPCVGTCKREHGREGFSITQWEKPCGENLCLMCVDGVAEEKMRVGAAQRTIETKRCAGVSCGLELVRESYSKTQWKKGDGHNLCLTCVDAGRQESQTLECGRCATRRPREEYSRLERETPSYMKILKKRFCNTCKDELDRRDLLEVPAGSGDRR